MITLETKVMNEEIRYIDKKKLLTVRMRKNTVKNFKLNFKRPSERLKKTVRFI